MHPLDSRIDKKKTELYALYDAEHKGHKLDKDYLIDRRRWTDERLLEYKNMIDKK